MNAHVYVTLFGKFSAMIYIYLFIDQYGNYSVTVDGEKINLNGINTQGENIADNGGYKEAFRYSRELWYERNRSIVSWQIRKCFKGEQQILHQHYNWNYPVRWVAGHQ